MEDSFLDESLSRRSVVKGALTLVGTLLFTAGFPQRFAHAAETLCRAKLRSVADNNPLINPPELPNGAPPFHLIKPEHCVPAVVNAIMKAEEKVATIGQNPLPPTFENTIAALSTTMDELRELQNIIQCLAGISGREDFNAAGKKSAVLSGQIGMDDILFRRIQSVFDRRNELGLSDEQIKLTDTVYRDFAESGKALSVEQKKKLRKIEERITKLTFEFGSNENVPVLFSVWVEDEAELIGLSEKDKAKYKKNAIQEGHNNKWLIEQEDATDIVTRCKNRSLRERVVRTRAATRRRTWLANKPVIESIIQLRQEKAQLLGFKNYADFMLDGTMMKTGQRALAWIEAQTDRDRIAREKERKEIGAYARRTDGVGEIESWDIDYYARKMKNEKFASLSKKLADYEVPLETAIAALQERAKTFLGVSLEEVRGDYPLPNKETRAFEIYDLNPRKLKGIIYADFFNRPGKMGDCTFSLKSRRITADGQEILPVSLCNFCFDRNASDIGLDGARTLFHEFGHAFNMSLAEGLYGKTTTLSARDDLTEYFSQLLESDLLRRESLVSLFRHAKTGEKMLPYLAHALLQKEKYLGKKIAVYDNHFSLIDMKLHTTPIEQIGDLEMFYESACTRAGWPADPPDFRLGQLTHLFGAGRAMAAGYFRYTHTQKLAEDTLKGMHENGEEKYKEALRYLYSSRDTMALLPFVERMNAGGPIAVPANSFSKPHRKEVVLPTEETPPTYSRRAFLRQIFKPH